MQGLMKFHQSLLKILRKQNVTDEWTDGWTDGRSNETVFMWLRFRILDTYVAFCLCVQELILATKVSNLRNKSHLFSKMTTIFAPLSAPGA